MTWKEMYRVWRDFETLDHTLKSELKKMEDNEAEQKEAFYAPLEFGTAGMRGIIGAGINRMNIYTVRQATEGMAKLLEAKGADAMKQGVAIAYDCRHMSPEFAMEAAKTLANHGIPSYLFESLRPTPELSFAVRYYKAAAGIMLTASHNPARYNGYKVYGADGGQMPPQDADDLTKYIRQTENPLLIKVMTDEHKAADLIHIIGEEVDDAYLKLVKTVSVDEELIKTVGKDLRLIFTPLHGTGKMLGERALKQAGFQHFKLVPEQAQPDPDFSTVTSPNPEEHEAFALAMELGEQEDADLLIATDPDADRLGAAVRLPDGTYKVLSGNQIGALLIDYLLRGKQATGTLDANGVVLKSIVSSELGSAICESYGVKMVNVLTGFKFIAEKIQQYEEDHSQTFLFGYEESYGYLVKPFVRDKDAIQALVLLAEVAAYYKSIDQTLYDGLLGLYQKHGFYQEKTISITMEGAEGSQRIRALMAKCRSQKRVSFGKFQVHATEDFAAGVTTKANGEEEPIDLPSADVLKYLLADDQWLAIRPSGTEPKIKFYLGVKGADQADADEKLSLLTEAVQSLMEEI